MTSKNNDYKSKVDWVVLIDRDHQKKYSKGAQYWSRFIND